MTEFQRGDHVTIGAYGKVHWEVEHAYFPKVYGWWPPEQVVILQSPMSQRRRSELARYLTLFRRPEADDLAEGL